MHEVCIPHRIPRAWEQANSKGEIRRSRHQSNSKRVVNNLVERHQTNSKRVVNNLVERNVGMKMKSPKQGLTSAEDLTLRLPRAATPTT